MKLEGRVALITGAARGLGREYALQFVAAGARVVVCDLRDCAETAAQCREHAGEALALRVDVTDARSTRDMAAAALERWGRIDVLVNNAALYGSLSFGAFETIAEAQWDAAMNVNVKGIWQCCRAVVPCMRKAGGGSIVNIASLAATYGMPYGLHYTTSKAAVIGLTRGLARELGRYDIRVNAVAPNVVDTEATAEFFGDKREQIFEVTRSQQALRRSLKPADVAGTVLYLASDDSRFTTGQTLMVDGGTVLL